MSIHKLFLGTLFVWAISCLGWIGQANAATVVNNNCSGWYSDQGYHPSIGSYYSGNAQGTQNNDFFVFDLTGISGTVSAATLNVAAYTITASGTYTIYATSLDTSIEAECASGSAACIANYSGLTSGTAIGSVSVTPDDSNSTLSIPLNSAGLSWLQANEGRSIVMGGSFPQPGTDFYYIFGNSDFTLTNNLTIDTGTSPPPSQRPSIKITPLSYDFGQVSLGSSPATPKEFTISNTGSADLNVSSISLSDVTDFALRLDGGTNPCNVASPIIAPGGSCTVNIVFCPSTSGAVNANVTITSNDIDKGVLTIPITGEAILETKNADTEGRLVIIDGMKLMSILNPGYQDDYSHYLYDAIIYADKHSYLPTLLQQKVGLLTPFVWSGDVHDTGSFVDELSGLLQTYTAENRHIVVLAHSWGTVLAYLAIAKPNIYVDKFVTLGSPLNAQSYIARSYTSDTLRQWSADKVLPLPNVGQWINWWATCDPLSGTIGGASNFGPIKTKYVDPETLDLTCHGSYYKDFDIWQRIIASTLIGKK